VGEKKRTTQYYFCNKKRLCKIIKLLKEAKEYREEKMSDLSWWKNKSVVSVDQFDATKLEQVVQVCLSLIVDLI
jgi:hypothetical protein